MNDKQLPARVVKQGEVVRDAFSDFRVEIKFDAARVIAALRDCHVWIAPMHPRARCVVFPFENDLGQGAIDGECTIAPLQERNDPDESDSLPALRR